MKRYKVGLIRVVSFEDEKLLNLHGDIIEKHYPNLEVSSRCINNQPNGIHDDETEELAVPKIIELARNWKDIDALIISCAGDPAVKELRKLLCIPVIGAGESTALLAKRFGSIFGTLGITKAIPGVYVEILGPNIVGTCDVEGITSTLDLMNEKGRRKVIKKATELKDLGAEVIALACTGMSTIDIAKEIEQVCEIPVIDPVIAEGLIALYECIRNGKQTKVYEGWDLWNIVLI